MRRTRLIAIIVAVAIIVGGCFGFLAIPWPGKMSDVVWSEDNAFTLDGDVAKILDINDSKHVDASGNHELVVLNLADIQLNGIKFDQWKPTFDMLTNLINTTNPDLITLTGDQVSGAYTRTALRKICKFLDSFGIPWAPVLGNHDGESDMSLEVNGDIYTSYNNCLFQKNDPALGMGNYIIGVKNGEELIHALFMIDSHSDVHDRVRCGDGYDYIWATQIAWYDWCVNGLTTVNGGKVVQSSCFFHIPLVEYKDAWALFESNEAVGGGEKRENICSSNYNSGLFDKIQELGSTKLVVAGHDHVNDFYAEYEGVTLAYGVKSGYGSYWHEDKIGGTTITINAKGETSLAYYYNNDGAIVKK